MFDKIEDYFLELKFVRKYHIDDFYFSMCRFLNKLVFWHTPIGFIKNVIKYRKFLSEDRWWDYAYILSMLHTKISKDAALYEKHGMTTMADHYSRQMKYCADIIDRILEDKYDERELISHNKKWGERSYNFDDEIFDCTVENANTPEEKEQEKKEFLACLKAAEIQKQKDVNELFKFLSDNILKWWD